MLSRRVLKMFCFFIQKYAAQYVANGPLDKVEQQFYWKQV